MDVVIGATGFLGAHLLAHVVKNGEKVRALYRTKASIDKANHILSYYNIDAAVASRLVEWVAADITDGDSLTEAFAGITNVYNCSGTVSFHKGDKQELINININGVRTLVNVCLQMNIAKLVHVSSIAAIGDSVNGDSIDESTTWTRNKHESWYSITKWTGETEVFRAYAEGLPMVVVNPSVILGPGNWKTGSPQLFATVDKGLNYYTNGKNGYVDVRDVCRAMILLKESPLEGERFIVSAQNLGYKECLDAVAEALNKKTPSRYASKLMMTVAGITQCLFLGKKAVLTKSLVRTAHKQSCYSNSKLAKALSFTFTPITDTIAFTAQCYLADKQNGNV